MTQENLPKHVQENRTYWDGMADQWIESGEHAWQAGEPYWGCWHLSESEVHLLPQDLAGKPTIELGCGTAYVSAWLARRGAIATGIDNSEKQLETAKRLAKDHNIPLTLHHGNAEATPYPDNHFDFAISEYGAAIWCDPYRWIPEAHRILKPGGHLTFLGNTPLSLICMPPSGDVCEPKLHRSYFDLHKSDWTQVEIDPGGIEFNLPISKWLQLFRETGFEVLDYLELQAPKDSPDRYSTPGAWAHKWPAEHVWKLQRR